MRCCWPINVWSRLIWLFTQFDWLKTLNSGLYTSRYCPSSIKTITQDTKCQQYKCNRNKTKNSRIERNNTAQLNINKNKILSWKQTHCDFYNTTQINETKKSLFYPTSYAKKMKYDASMDRAKILKSKVLFKEHLLVF